MKEYEVVLRKHSIDETDWCTVRCTSKPLARHLAKIIERDGWEIFGDAKEIDTDEQD